MTTPIITPKRTREQRLQALQHANEIRAHRARVKVRLAAGEVGLVDLIDDPYMATAKVVEFLRCIPKIGKVKAHRALQASGVSPSKTFSGMTERQWRSLASLLHANQFYAAHEQRVAANERTAA